MSTDSPTDSQTTNMSSEGYPDLMLRALWESKSDDQTQREADYLDATFELDGPGRLLDVPCGNGRITLELAARGHHITGIDLAESAIVQAQADAKTRKLTDHVTFQQGDMRELPWEAEFDGAYCFWESFGYFDDDGNRGFLESVARTLKPGAKFVMDTHIIETMLPGINRRDWTRLEDGTLVLERRAYDHITSSVIRRWTVIGEHERAEAVITVRLYTYRELVALLESAGFTACQGYAWLSIVPYMYGAPRVVMVATRA